MKRMMMLVIGIPLLSLVGGALIWFVAQQSPDEDIVAAEAMSKISWQNEDGATP